MDKLKNYGKQFGKVMAQPVAATLLGLLVGAVFILVSHITIFYIFCPI